MLLLFHHRSKRKLETARDQGADKRNAKKTKKQMSRRSPSRVAHHSATAMNNTTLIANANQGIR
jgi:hypothetical protein